MSPDGVPLKLHDDEHHPRWRTVLSRTLATLMLAASASIVIFINAIPAQAGACSIFPKGADPMPVFAEATTSSPQIGTLPRGGTTSSCTAGVGEAYDLCGGGSLWYSTLGGFVPYACVWDAW